MKKYFYYNIIILFSFIMGIITGNLIIAPFLTGTAFVFFIIGSFFVAYPILLIILLIIPLIIKKLSENLKIWSLLSIPLIPLFFLIYEFIFNYSKNFTFLEYVSLKNIQEGAFLAIICTITSVIIFYNISKFLENKQMFDSQGGKNDNFKN